MTKSIIRSDFVDTSGMQSVPSIKHIVAIYIVVFLKWYDWSLHSVLH